jgi:hypothetical protein
MSEDRIQADRLYLAIQLLKHDVMGKLDESRRSKDDDEASAYASVMDLINTIMRENNIHDDLSPIR